MVDQRWQFRVVVHSWSQNPDAVSVAKTDRAALFSLRGCLRKSDRRRKEFKASFFQSRQRGRFVGAIAFNGRVDRHRLISKWRTLPQMVGSHLFQYIGKTAGAVRGKMLERRGKHGHQRRISSATSNRRCLH